jgi:hypothetical protein
MSSSTRGTGDDATGIRVGGGAIEELIRETAKSDVVRLPAAAAGDPAAFMAEVISYARERSARPGAMLTAPAVFILSEYPARIAEEQGLPRVRGFKVSFDNDISGGVYITGSGLGEVYGAPADCSSVNAVFEELTRRSLHTLPAVILLPGTEVIDCRQGAINEDRCVTIPIQWEPVTVASVDFFLDGFYRSYIQRPHEGAPIWHDRNRHVPSKGTEQVIQKLLIPVARAFFSTTHHVNDETDVDSGRLDVSLLPYDPAVAGGSCVLELKVLREKAFRQNAKLARPYADRENAEALRKGITQALNYRRDLRCEHAFLCAYDMRKDYTNQELLERFAGDAVANNVLVRRFFAFTSAEAYRRAQPGAVPHRVKPRVPRGAHAKQARTRTDATPTAPATKAGQGSARRSAKKKGPSGGRKHK